MAKTYAFTVTLQQAEPSHGADQGIAIVYGGSDSTYATETKECALSEVLAFRDEVSAKEPRLHAAFIRMADRRARKPAGFDALTRGYKRGGKAEAEAA